MPRAARWITCCTLVFVARPVSAEPELGGFARIGGAITSGPTRATGTILGLGFAARWDRLELEIGTELDTITSPEGRDDGPNIRSMLDARIGGSHHLGGLAVRASAGLGWGTEQVYRGSQDFEVSGWHAELRAGVEWPFGLEVSAGAHLPLFRIEARKDYQDDDALVWWPTFDLSVGVNLQSARPRRAYLETIAFVDLAASAMVVGGVVNLVDRIDDGCNDTCMNTRDRGTGGTTAVFGLLALAVAGPAVHGLFHNERGFAQSVAYRLSLVVAGLALGQADEYLGAGVLVLGMGATPLVDYAIASRAR